MDFPSVHPLYRFTVGLYKEGPKSRRMLNSNLLIHNNKHSTHQFWTRRRQDNDQTGKGQSLGQSTCKQIQFKGQESGTYDNQGVFVPLSWSCVGLLFLNAFCSPLFAFCVLFLFPWLYAKSPPYPQIEHYLNKLPHLTRRWRPKLDHPSIYFTKCLSKVYTV